jgi:hypothetical protein
VQQPFQRREQGHRSEQAQAVDRSEPDVVRQRHREHPRALTESILRELAERADERLVVLAACRRDQHEAVHPLGSRMRHLEPDGATHRVAEQNGLLDVEGVEYRQYHLGQGGDVEDVVATFAAPVSREVRHHVDPAPRQSPGRRHEVLARDREAVQMDDGHSAPARATPAVDRLPGYLQTLRHPAGVARHGRIVSHADSAATPRRALLAPPICPPHTRR